MHDTMHDTRRCTTPLTHPSPFLSPLLAPARPLRLTIILCQVVDSAMAHPRVMIASDGIPYVNGKAHPRGAGCFSRVGADARTGEGIISHTA
jgi:hypothetical protein